MSKIYLIIDTSIYRQSPNLQTSSFNTIIKMCRADIIKLFIPYIVEREFITSIEDETNQICKEILQKREKIKKYIIKNTKLRIDMIDYITTTDFNSIKEDVLKNWDNFKVETNAKILEIQNHHGKMVMESYFNGNKPFVNKKNRSDIPDAFIYFAIKDLINDNNHIYFITKDRKLIESITELKVINTFTDLDNFLSDSMVKKVLKDVDNEHALKKAIKVLKYYKDELKKKYKQVIKIEMEAIDISSPHIEDFMEDPEVEYATKIVYNQLDIENAKQYSDGNIALHFDANVTSELYYTLDKSRIIEIPEIRIKNNIHIEDESSYTYFISEKFTYNCKGVFGIIIPIDQSIEKINQNEIKVNIEKFNY